VSTENESAAPIQSTSELASRLGISRWTVSRALNGHPVDPGTRRRIEEEARRARFLPNASARTLRSGKSRIVGAIVRDLESFNLTSKLGRLQEALANSGLHLMLEIASDEPASEQTARSHLLSLRPVALLRFASLAPEPLETGVPEVFVDPQFKTASNAVTADRASAIRLAVRYLRSNGCRRIAAFGIDPSTAYGRERTRALKTEIAKQDLSPEKAFRQFWQADRDLMDETYGHDLAAKAANWITSKTGIVALNDRIAIGALGRLHSNHPKIVGYDNSPWTRAIRPALTTIDPDNDHLIETATNMLAQLLSGKTSTPLPIRKIRPKLIPRDT